MIRLRSEFVYAGNYHKVYSADAPGDELPPGLHKHDDFEHLTVAMSGEIEAFFDDREPIGAVPGDPPFEFAIGRFHGIRAKTAGAVFMSIQRNVQGEC